jgi:WD40 repeat protein
VSNGAQLPGNTAADVLGLAFSADGELLASGGKGNSLSVYDVGAKNRLRGNEQAAGWVVSLAFSGDKSKLLCGGPYAVATLRDAKTFDPIHALEGHRGAIPGVAFTPDERRLVTIGGEGTVRFWDAATGAHLATLWTLEKNGWIVVASDGRYDASKGAPACCAWRGPGLRLKPLGERPPTPDLLATILR